MKFTIPTRRPKKEIVVPATIEPAQKEKSLTDRIVEDKTAVAVQKAVDDIRTRVETFVEDTHTKKIIIGVGTALCAIGVLALLKKRVYRTSKTIVYVYGSGSHLHLA